MRFLAYICSTCIMAATAYSAPVMKGKQIPSQASRSRPISRTQKASPKVVKSVPRAPDTTAAEQLLASDLGVQDETPTTIKCGELTGAASFETEGNTFTLKVGGATKTGVFSTNTTGNYKAVALWFKDRAESISFKLVKNNKGTFDLVSVEGENGPCRIANIDTRWPPKKRTRDLSPE